MADDVTLPGSGAVIATDDIGAGRQVQRVKVGWGPDGTLNDVDAASGKAMPAALYNSAGVELARAEDAASGDGHFGMPALAVRQATPADSSNADGDYEFLRIKDGLLWTRPIAAAVTCSTDITRPADTTAYANGDNFSDSTSAPTSGGFTFTSAARKSGGSGIITDIWISSSNPTGGMAGEIWIFDSAVTNINDNAAFAISDTEIKTVVAKIPFTTVADTNNAGVHVSNINAMFTTVGSANLRYLVKLKGAYTPASAEVLTVRLKALQLD